MRYPACPISHLAYDGLITPRVPVAVPSLRRRSHIRLAKKQSPEAFEHLEGEVMSSLMARFSAAEKIRLQTAFPEAPGSAQPRRRL